MKDNDAPTDEQMDRMIRCISDIFPECCLEEEDTTSSIMCLLDCLALICAKSYCQDPDKNFIEICSHHLTNEIPHYRKQIKDNE